MSDKTGSNESAVTKKDIVRAISEARGLTQSQTKEIVQMTFDAIIEALVTHRRIELRNFGVFEVKTRAARKARNPKTGQQVMVPPKHVVSFKPGKVMEAKVLHLDDAAAADMTEGSTGAASLASPSSDRDGASSNASAIRDASDLWQ